jgi:recombinational DNA repair protein RecR
VLHKIEIEKVPEISGLFWVKHNYIKVHKMQFITDTIITEITQRIVNKLNPEQIIFSFFSSFANFASFAVRCTKNGL